MARRRFLPKQGWFHPLITFICRSALATGFVTMMSCDSRPQLPPGDPDNGGLVLPGGFEAVVVVDSLKGRTRHMAVNDNGDIYVKLRFPQEEGGNMALRDVDGDGKADEMEVFGDYKNDGSYGAAMRIYNGYLY
jgi:hypothetical protein